MKKSIQSLVNEFGTIQIGVDGNCGFALLGKNIQSGEAEFVRIPPGVEYPNNYRSAAKTALKKLRDRLEIQHISYYLGESYI